MANITGLIIKDKDMEIDRLKKRITELEQEIQEMEDNFRKRIWRD